MAIVVDVSGAIAKLEEAKKKAEEGIVDYLALLGERFVEVAHETKTFTDRTGKLSSSIGYGVFKDRSLVRFGGFGGGEGEVNGLNVLENADVDNFPTLIVVAGMNYATYVERRGYAVLDGARIRAEQIVESLKMELI